MKKSSTFSQSQQEVAKKKDPWKDEDEDETNISHLVHDMAQYSSLHGIGWSVLSSYVHYCTVVFLSP